MKKTCKSCAWFFLYPDPAYNDIGICEETRAIMSGDAPACNYYVHDREKEENNERLDSIRRQIAKHR